MADAADIAGEIDARVVERGIRPSAPMAVGVPGDCEGCDHYSPRLVRGRCASCRDGRRR